MKLQIEKKKNISQAHSQPLCYYYFISAHSDQVQAHILKLGPDLDRKKKFPFHLVDCLFKTTSFDGHLQDAHYCQKRLQP